MLLFTVARKLLQEADLKFKYFWLKLLLVFRQTISQNGILTDASSTSMSKTRLVSFINYFGNFDCYWIEKKLVNKNQFIYQHWSATLLSAESPPGVQDICFSAFAFCLLLCTLRNRTLFCHATLIIDNYMQY